MSERCHVAVHEAGHAVIGRALSMVCGGATIAVDKASAGHSVTAEPHVIIVQWELREKFRDEASAFRGRMMTFMAGAEAEREILGKCTGGDGDDCYQVALMASEIVREERREALEARLRRMTRQLVRRHRARIERVAAVLMERETLSGKEIDALLPPSFMARPVTWAFANLQAK